MKTDQLQSLLAEYRMCSSVIEKQITEAYKAIVLAVVIAGALAAYTSDTPGLGGLVFEYGLALAVVALAFMESLISGYGLRLVELELLINRAAETPKKNGICWFSRYTGSGFAVFPGYRCSIALVSLLGVAILTVSFMAAFSGLKATFPLPHWAHYTLVTLPLPIILFGLITIGYSEWTAARKKTELLAAGKRPIDC